MFPHPKEMSDGSDNGTHQWTEEGNPCHHSAAVALTQAVPKHLPFSIFSFLSLSDARMFAALEGYADRSWRARCARASFRSRKHIGSRGRSRSVQANPRRAETISGRRVCANSLVTEAWHAPPLSWVSLRETALRGYVSEVAPRG